MANKKQSSVLGIIGGSGVYDIEGWPTSAGSAWSRRLVPSRTNCCSVS